MVHSAIFPSMLNRMTADLAGALASSVGLVLALILARAAWGKFQTPDATIEAMAGFRLPAWMRKRAFALMLPAAETLLAIGLIVAPGWWFTATAAATTALFAFFWWIVRTAVRRKEEARCNCFGREVSLLTRHSVSRNVGLLVLSAAALAGSLPSPGAVIWRTDWIVWTAAAALLVVAAWTGTAFARDQSANDPDRVSRITTAQEFGLRSSDRTLFPLTRTSLERPVLLVFAQAGHASSVAAAKAALAWRDHDPAQRLVKIVIDENQVAFNVPHFVADDDLLVDSARMATRLAGITAYPAALLVGRDSRLATSVVGGEVAINELLEGLDQVMPASAR